MLRDIDLAKVNSLTKYPSIETYHRLGQKGRLTEVLNLDFAGQDVFLTEKVDGTNGRVVFLPSGEWLIGSREEFFTAEGDVVYNPGLGIVDALRPVARRIKPLVNVMNNSLLVFYFEVFGGGIGQYAKNYTTKKDVFGVRIFDVADVLDLDEKLSWDRERIASWRDHGGQEFVMDAVIDSIANLWSIPRVPFIGRIEGDKLPTDVVGMANFLAQNASVSMCVLDDSGRGEPEGIVLRTADRSKIAKARFQDYDRTIKMGRG